MRYFSKKIRLFCLTLALLTALAPSALAASGFRLNAQEQSMIEMVNSDRARYGRPALTLDLELCALAREKCKSVFHDTISSSSCGFVNHVFFYLFRFFYQEKVDIPIASYYNIIRLLCQSNYRQILKSFAVLVVFGD